MSIFTSRPALRWGVPVAVFAVAIGGGVAARTLSASAGTALPDRTAAQLLVDLQTARLDAGSGTLVEKADLGLPSLPGLGAEGDQGLTRLASGSHTIRVWYSGPDKARVALLDTLGESDMITNGTDLWQWESNTNTATHRVLGEHAPDASGAPDTSHRPALDPSRLPQTPQQAANEALAAVGPSTRVTTSGSAVVAGRSAYELALEPKDTSSTIGRITVAIDSDKHVPLRVQVFPANSDTAAFQVAFTQISFDRPDASQFAFSPPPGSKITEEKPDATQAPENAQPPKTGQSAPAGERPTVVGTGWTSVVVAKVPAGTDARSAGQLTSVLNNLPRVSGAWGQGHLLGSKLVNVLVTDDGRVIAGAVHPDRLYQVAAIK